MVPFTRLTRVGKTLLQPRKPPSPSSPPQEEYSPSFPIQPPISKNSIQIGLMTAFVALTTQLSTQDIRAFISSSPRLVSLPVMNLYALTSNR